jgi:hypothetical protein
MRYYQLTCSQDTKEIGFYPQVGTASLLVNEEPDAFASSDSELNSEYQSAITPMLMMHTDAKITDLLSSSVTGSNSMLMNKKMRAVLEQFKEEAIRFFAVSVKSRSNIYSYWLPNPFQFDFPFLDFQRSVISIVGESGNKVTGYSPKTATELCSMIEFLKPPQTVSIDFPVFLRNCKENILILRNAGTEPTYYISENVKAVLNAELCSGVKLELLNYKTVRLEQAR